MQLHNHISNLLNNHNCVIVPNFGGFIANYAPASINLASHVIYPPYKQVLFNLNLTKNDGLLANEVMTKEFLSYENSLQKIETNVSDWRKKLNLGERIELGEIGFLYSQNDQIVFEQNRETNLLLEAYGLKQIAFIDFTRKVEVVHEKKVEVLAKKAIVQKENTKVELKVEKKIIPIIALDTNTAIEEVTQEKETKIISLPEKNKKSNKYKYMAAAVALPILFYSYWIPMKTDFLNTGKIQVSDFNPLRSSSKKTYAERTSDFVFDQKSDWKSFQELTAELPADILIYNYEFNEETYIAVDLNREPVVENLGTEAPFHLIGGCFSIKRNAENFVTDLTSKGYKAFIVDKNNGLHRVSAGGFQSEQDAETALDSFKNQGFSGWILKK